MEPTYDDKKLMIAIVSQDLADIDPRTLNFGEWPAILSQATRKLAYWLEQPVDKGWLDVAQEALCDLARCADGSDLTHEFGWELAEEDREGLRDGFDDAYESAVIGILGVKPRG